MSYDGKIKNGLILKKSEDGFFLRTIKKIISNNFLRTIKKIISNDEVWYKLSYDEQEHKYFDKEFLIKYLNVNYLDDKNKEIDVNNLDDKNKEIYEKNLINDLITLKTYSDDVDINVRKESDIGQFFSIVVAIISILTNAVDFTQLIGELILFLEVLTIVIFLIYRVFIGSKSESYKLKVINNVVYTLEAIKEDMDKNGYDSMEYTEMNSDVNDYQSDDTTDEMSTEVKRFTENDKDIYDGLKLTEVREVRTYKATKNKYSPRAMYERKRR